MGWATVCRYGGIGDNIVASSVLPGLKAKYGNVEVITQRPQHVVFENNPFVDKLSVYNKDDIPGHYFADWHHVRSKESDFFVNLSHSMETLLAFLPAQTQFQWPADARRRIADKSYLEMVHDICGLTYDTIAPNFFPRPEEEEYVRKIKEKVGERCIAWVLTGTRVDKIYPWATYCIGRIIHELNIPVVMLGAPAPAKDIDCALAIRDHVIRQNGSNKDLHFCISATDWPIRRVLAFVQQSDLVIGPDTGPMWAAAMCDVQKIMLLSHASPENITKYWKNTTTLHADQDRVDCWPCHQLHDKLETCRRHKLNEVDVSDTAACIADITVETVLEAARVALTPPVPVVSLANHVHRPAAVGDE